MIRLLPVFILIISLVSCVTFDNSNKSSKSLEQIIDPLHVQFNHLQLDGDFSESEKDSIITISNSLKSRLVDSPYFDIVFKEEEGKFIHGEVSKSGNFYYLTVYLTDFDKQSELSTADYKFLSLTDFSYAVNQVALQLEGHEISSGNGESSIPILDESNIEIPEVQIDDDSKLKQMYSLFEQELVIGNRAILDKDYGTAVEIFTEFQNKFDDMLTDEYRRKLIELLNYSVAQENLAHDFILLKTIKDESEEIAKLQQHNDFEGILTKYDEYVDEINKRSREDSEILRDPYKKLVGIRNQYNDLCKKLIDEKRNEFEFNLNYYAFQYDEIGVQNSFTDFIAYATKSRYWENVLGVFIDNYIFYNSKFDLSLFKKTFYNSLTDLSISKYTNIRNRYYQSINYSSDFNKAEKNMISKYHLVHISSGYAKNTFSQDWCDSFYIGKYELTQYEYSLYNRMGGNSKTLPVTNITWVEAAKFCNMLNEEIGLLPYYKIEGDNIYEIPANGGFHLPTLLQWRRVAFDVDGNPRQSINRSGVEGQVHNVGIYAPNSFGIYDLFGNVIEYCSDSSDADPVKNKTAISDWSNMKDSLDWTNQSWLIEPFKDVDYYTGMRLAYDLVF